MNNTTNNTTNNATVNNATVNNATVNNAFGTFVPVATKHFGNVSVLADVATATWGLDALEDLCFETVNVLTSAKRIYTETEKFQLVDINFFDEEIGDKKIRKAESRTVTHGSNLYLIHESTEVSAMPVTTTAGNRTFRSKDNFTMDYITVSGDMEFISSLQHTSVYFSHKEGAAYTYDKLQGKYYNYNTCKFRKTLPKEAVEYKYFIFTSNSIKDNKCVMYRVRKGVDSNYLLNAVIPGFIDLAKKEMDLVAANKFGARAGLAFSKGNTCVRLDKVALFDGKFDNTFEEVGPCANRKTKRALNKVKRANNSIDGAVFMPASVAKAIFKVATTKEAVRLIVQARIYGVNKFQIIVVPDKLYFAMIDECKSRGDVSYIVNKDIDPSVGDKLMPAIILDENAVKAKIDPTDVMLTIMSIGKITEGKLSKQAIEKILVAAAEQGVLDEAMDYLEQAGIKGIADIINGAFRNVTDEEALEDEDRDNRPAIDKDYIIDVLKSVEPNSPIIYSEAQRNAIKSIKNLIDKLGITLTDEDGNCTIFNAVVSADLASVFGAKIIKEDEVVFGKFSRKLMHIRRKFGVDSDEYKRAVEKYGEMIGIKYPSMYTNEYASATVLDLQEVLDRIDAHETLTAVQKEGLKLYYENMADATIAFPAHRGTFELCAGMDIDFDKICVIFDKFIVNLLKGKSEALSISAEVVDPDDADSIIKQAEERLPKEEADAIAAMVRGIVGDNNKRSNEIDMAFAKLLNPGLVTINGDKASASSVNTFRPAKEGFFAKIHSIQGKYQGKIGIITHYNNKTVALLVECLNGNFEPAKQFLKQKIGSTVGAKEAYAIDQDVVDPLYAVKMISTMKYIAWTNETIIAFLKDCSKLFRLYQETTIDAAKTGIFLAILLEVDTFQIASLLSVDTREVDNEEVSGQTEIYRKDYKARKVSKMGKDGKKVEFETFLVQDKIAALQDRLMVTANKSANTVIRANKEKFSYTTGRAQDFLSAINALEATKPQLLRDLFLLKDCYVKIAKDYALKVAGLDTKAYDYDDQKDALRQGYELRLGAISNAVCRTVSKLPKSWQPKHIGALLLGVSVTNEYTKEVYRNSSNKFAYATAPGYTYNYLVGGNTYTAVGHVLQKGLEVAGEVELVKGVSAKGLVIAEKYTGTVYFDGDKEVTVEKSFDLEGFEEDRYMVIARCGEGNTSTVVESDKLKALVTVNKGNVTFEGDVTVETINELDLGTALYFDGTSKTKEFYVDNVFVMPVQANKNAGQKAKAFYEYNTDCFIFDLAICEE